MATSILTSIHGKRFGLAPNGEAIFQGRPFSVTATPAAGAANISLVTLQVVDSDDAAVAGVFTLDVYLSDAASGAGLTATTASGAVGAGTAGTDLDAMVAKKYTRVQTDATGKYILSITDTAKTLFKICVVMGNKNIVCATLVTGNFG